MKKTLLLLFVIQFTLGFSQTVTKILLIHPTVKNINTFKYLSENKIIDIDNVQFIGVYHKDERYDYSKSLAYISDSNIINFSLVMIDSSISRNELFVENKLTPQLDSLFTISDGAIFTGGDDIPASVYSEKTSFLTDIADPYRHYFEVSFLNHLLNMNSGDDAFLNKKPDYVILGICLGMQTINVASGGTMYQDIPTEVYKLSDIESATAIQSKMHKNYVRLISDDKSIMGSSLHRIVVYDREDKITSLFKHNKTPFVLSWHHQAVKKTGHHINVIFTSEDGNVIEGINHNRFDNVYGLQFHPEYIKIYNNDLLRFKLEDDEKGFTDLLKEKNSYQFHVDLWKFFSEMYKD